MGRLPAALDPSDFLLGPNPRNRGLCEVCSSFTERAVNRARETTERADRRQEEQDQQQCIFREILAFLFLLLFRARWRAPTRTQNRHRKSSSNWRRSLALPQSYNRVQPRAALSELVRQARK